LEPYFAAIGSDNRDNEVPKLLISDDPIVLRRTLLFICGGIWPWPNEPDEFERMYSTPAKRGNVLIDQVEAVREVVQRDVEDVRALAASVYAELAGKKAIEFMRTLLHDQDAAVRATAIGVLASHRDEASIDTMTVAAAGVDDGWTACKVIESLSPWDDQRLVPILITFLQNDSLAYQYGDDLGIPALKARTAIAQLTGHWFPYDVARSLKAWREVESVADHVRRKELLQKLLPGSRFPIVAELIGAPRRQADRRADDSGPDSDACDSAKSDLLAEVESTDVRVTVRLRNVSNSDLAIAKLPAWYEQSWPAGVSSRGLGVSEVEIAKEDFVHLTPAGTVTFELSLDGSLLLAEPNSRKLSLTYRNNGNGVGVNAWIGVLEAEFGEEWKEERRLEKVEERWPNGNLKAVGQTVNGQQYGEWNYFNEEGDRVRIVDYSGGGGEAACNPEHPANKGAGKKKR
jgi:hypothetical protein